MRDSAIYKAPPHVREIWDWLLMNANFKDNGSLKRGQVLTSYNEILEDLSWFVGYRKESYKKHHCETAMKLLAKEQMITTTKTTRGLLVTVLNYDKYQDASNYETDKESYIKTTTEPQQSHTKTEEGKKVKKEKNNIARFDEFWTAYPRKISKATAKKAWIARGCDGDKFDAIMAALEKQVSANNWTKENIKFIPYPASWINGERWEDEIVAHAPEKDKCKTCTYDADGCCSGRTDEQRKECTAWVRAAA